MENNTKLGYTVFASIGAVLIFALIVLPAFSVDNTIFLTTKNGGTPISCAPTNGLVLAQNLTDLCDVTIISPLTGELIGFNGSQWVNVSEATFNDTATCANLGSGVIICPNYSGANVNLRTLVNGLGISINNDTNTITISNTGVLSDNAGTGISVNQTTGNVLITNTLPENTVCDNSLHGEGLCINDLVTLKNLLAGTGITLSSNSTNITLTNSGIISNQCDTGINCSGTNSAIFNTDFVNGTGIRITGTTSQTFTNTGVTSLTSADTATLTYNSSTGAVLSTPTIRKLCESTASGGETSLTCTLSSSQQILLVMIDVTQTGDTNTVLRMQFNADGGNNYATRSSTNGGADATTGSIAGIVVLPSGTTGSQYVHNNYRCIDLASSLEKHCYGERTTSANGAGNVPSRVETASKWANTANDITSVSVTRTAGTGTMESGNNIIVWGLS